jgi:hypothetical protein
MEPLEGRRYVIFLHLEEALRKIYCLSAYCSQKWYKEIRVYVKTRENVKNE